MRNAFAISGALWVVTLALGCGKAGSPEATSPAPASGNAPRLADTAPAAPQAPEAAPLASKSAPATPPPEGIILPEEETAGPAMLGVDTEIEGSTWCAMADLGMTGAQALAVKTDDKKVYIVDDAPRKFAEAFQNRAGHRPVRVRGVPYLKDGVLHITASEVRILR